MTVDNSSHCQTSLLIRVGTGLFPQWRWNKWLLGFDGFNVDDGCMSCILLLVKWCLGDDGIANIEFKFALMFKLLEGPVL